MSSYQASIKDGIFKRKGENAYARAAQVMSTQSDTEFEWSVKLIGSPPDFDFGIASKFDKSLRPEIYLDNNAIFYWHGESTIGRGDNDTYHNIPKPKDGDVIRFRFQPQRKKLVFDFVRI